MLSLSPARTLILLAALGCASEAWANACQSTGASTSWAAAAAWSSCGGTTPQAADTVTVQNGHTINIDTTPITVTSITLNGSGILNFSGGAKALTVTGDITMGGTSQFTVTAQGGTNTHTLAIGGNLTNTSTHATVGLDFVFNTNDTVTVTFNKAGTSPLTQTVSGNGTVMKFNRITVNMGNGTTDVVEIDNTTTNFTLTAGNLTLTKGTLKYSSPSATTFIPFTANPAYGANAGLWINGGTMTYAPATFTFSGLFRISGGTTTIGDAADERLLPIAGSQTTVEGGTLNIAGRYTRNTVAEAFTFTMTGGTMNVGTVGNTSTTLASFHLEAQQTFNMSGGTIVIQQPGAPNATPSTANANLGYTNLATTNTVTGGTLQLGNSATGAVRNYNINATAPIGNLVVDATTNTKYGRLLTNNLTVLNDVTINDTAGDSTLDANNLNITLGTTTGTSTWTNNGIFLPGRGTVTFTGNTTQTISGTTTTTFNNLTVNKSSGTLTAGVSFNVSRTLTFTSGTIGSTSSNIVTISQPQLTGTLSTSTASTTVTGVGTAFTTELQNGDLIINPATGATLGTVNAIASATSLTLTGNASATTAGINYRRTAGATSGSGAGKYANTCMRKQYISTSTGFTFPLGDGTNYTPVTQTFNSNAGAISDVTACVTAGKHGQITTPIPTTGIDKTKMVARYWTLTANAGGTGTPTGAYGVNFTYVSGDNDDTSAPVTGAYVIERYDTSATVWFPTTISGTPNSTSAATTNGQTTAYGDYAIGDPLSGFASVSPGRFNAFEVPSPVGSTQIIGKVFTRVAADSITLRIVAINSSKTAIDTAFAQGATITLLDASDNTGSFDANGCKPNWTAISTVNGGGPFTTANLVAGKLDVVFSPPATANVYRDVRVKVVDTLSGALIGCSTDRFAIRPKELLVAATDTDWRNTGTGRTLNNTGAVHGAGRAFTLTVTARNSGNNTTDRYTTANGAAAATVSGSPSCSLPTTGNGCVQATVAAKLTNASLSFSSGVATATPTYDEAGTFGYEISDASWASVDNADGTPTTGSTGYTIPQAGSPPLVVGMFVPDKFAISSGTSTFQTFGTDNTGCSSRQFTYIGQSFWYATLPSATITAQNASGTTTSYYSTAGGTASSLGSPGIAFAETYPATDGGLAITVTPSGSVALGSFVNGAATYTGNSAGTIVHARSATTPTAPFTSSIVLSAKATDSTYSATTGNPGQGANPALESATYAFPAAGFDAGAGFRYGRMRLVNATGSEVVDLTVPFRAEYYTGSGFATNTLDSCTKFQNSNFTFIATSYAGGVSAGNLPTSKISYSATALALSGGLGKLKITNPGAGVSGSVRLCLDLDASDATCSATSAGKSWLQGAWGSSSYVWDTNSRVAFGLYGSIPNQVIFFRENY